jgi:hypothetical protein
MIESIMIVMGVAIVGFSSLVFLEDTDDYYYKVYLNLWRIFRS